AEAEAPRVYLLSLAQATRSAERGPADPVALEELGLGAEDLPFGPPPSGDVGDDGVGDGGGEGGAVAPLGAEREQSIGPASAAGALRGAGGACVQCPLRLHTAAAIVRGSRRI